MEKSFMQRWKEGFREITPLQQAEAQVWGNAGAVIGLILGVFFTLYQKNWWLAFTIAFFVFLQVIAYIGAKQKASGMKEMEEMPKNFEKKDVVQNG